MRLRPDTEQGLVRADIDFRCARELAGESDHPGHVVAQQCLQFAEGPGFDRVAERAANEQIGRAPIVLYRGIAREIWVGAGALGQKNGRGVYIVGDGKSVNFVGASRAAGPTLEEIAGRACARSVTCVPAS